MITFVERLFDYGNQAGIAIIREGKHRMLRQAIRIPQPLFGRSLGRAVDRARISWPDRIRARVLLKAWLKRRMRQGK